MAYNNITPIWLVELESIERLLEDKKISYDRTLELLEKSSAPDYVKLKFAERNGLDI